MYLTIRTFFFCRPNPWTKNKSHWTLLNFRWENFIRFLCKSLKPNEIKPPSKSTHPYEGIKVGWHWWLPIKFFRPTGQALSRRPLFFWWSNINDIFIFPCPMSMPLESDIGGLVTEETTLFARLDAKSNATTNKWNVPAQGVDDGSWKNFLLFPSTKKYFSKNIKEK